MDIATIIGFLIAAGGIVFAMYEGTEGEFKVFFSSEGFILVMGGAIGLSVMSMPFEAAKGLPAYLKKCLFHKETHAKHLIEQIVQFAEIARRDGVLALENSVKSTSDPFLKKGLQLAIDGADPAVIEQVMNIEMAAIEERHHHGKKMFELMGKYGPALGLTATLVGQVCMFKKMSAPEPAAASGGEHAGGGGGGGQAAEIAHALQIALLGTLYGTVWANVVCGPLFDKLSIRSKEELFNKQIILQGILAIQAGDNPRIVESKLLSFLSSKERAHMAPAGGAKEK
ncbi:MAG TPA: MotA/TolQ/ExbB proton channel family protein [Phycisphaerae bacterium]|jgi:chemotaxis protein MotA|nr:MotA/TolQ/ExbB proton channel family protein [Phycisphaerae bacterium]